jgi:hypothetical protein
MKHTINKIDSDLSSISLSRHKNPDLRCVHFHCAQKRAQRGKIKSYEKRDKIN